MFKNYKLNLVMMTIALIGSIGLANATNNVIPTTTITENIGDWVEVHDANGTKVYFASYENFDGSLCLKIKFENQTSQSANLSWSVINKGTQASVREGSSEVAANSSLEYVNNQDAIAIPIGETVDSFSISIQ